MKLVTFDFHNTLARCDTWFELEVRHLASAVADEVAPHADPALLDAAYRQVRQQVMTTGEEIDAVASVRAALATANVAAPDDAIEASVERLMRAAMHDLAAVPGATTAIAALHDAGYTLGVVSSAVHHGYLEWALAEFGILDRFAFVLTSARAGIYKSSPTIYQRAMALVNAVPASSLHVGDSKKWDVETAARAGMHTGWLVSPQRYETSTPPDLTFASLVGAGPIIDRYMRALP